MEDTLQLKAYAKINLALDVVGKREDGYHEVRMIMQTVKLYDSRAWRLICTNAFQLLPVWLAAVQIVRLH